jgi:putative toxin-antitoxin system antitoxin component (TIGR02293 family)
MARISKTPPVTTDVKVRKPSAAETSKAVDITTIAGEAAGTYYRKTNIGDWLAISAASRPMVSEFDLIKLGGAGVTKNAIHNLASSIGISRKDIAEGIFNISVKTLERKSTKTKLDKKTSSHAVEIAKVLQHAYDVFRDKDKLKRWLNTENKALNNLKPVVLFDTLTGLTMVNDILGRIEDGVYS